MNLAFALLLVASSVELEMLEPRQNAVLTDRSPNFKWQGVANSIWIDNNPEFSSPFVQNVTGSSFQIHHELDFGLHYWKLVGMDHSIVSSFTIDSLVAVKQEIDHKKMRLKNSGNTAINVTRPLSSITAAVVMERNESIQLEIDKLMTIIVMQP